MSTKCQQWGRMFHRQILVGVVPWTVPETGSNTKYFCSSISKSILVLTGIVLTTDHCYSKKVHLHCCTLGSIILKHLALGQKAFELSTVPCYHVTFCYHVTVRDWIPRQTAVSYKYHVTRTGSRQYYMVPYHVTSRYHVTSVLLACYSQSIVDKVSLIIVVYLKGVSRLSNDAWCHVTDFFATTGYDMSRDFTSLNTSRGRLSLLVTWYKHCTLIGSDGSRLTCSYHIPRHNRSNHVTYWLAVTSNVTYKLQLFFIVHI